MTTRSTKDIEDLSDEEWIKAHLQEAAGGYPSGLNRTEAGRRMLAADADRRTSLVTKGIELWIESTFHDAGKVASELLRSNAKEWTGLRLVKVVEAASALDRTHKAFTHFSYFPHKPLITAAEKAIEREGLSSELRLALERWKTALMPRALTAKEERELGEAERITADNNDQLPWSKVSDAFATMDRLQRIRTPLTEERKLIERLSRLLSSSKDASAGSNDEITLRIDTTDAVGILVAADTAKGQRAAGQAWAALLQHARALATTTPSRKWSNDAARLVSAISSERFGACASDWLNEAGKPAPQRLVSYREVADATLLNDSSVELLKGLAWSVVAAGRADLAPALGNLAEACFKKVPNIGPRNVKVGNAAVAALAALSDAAAAAQLSRLRLSVKHPSSRATIDKAFAAISRNTGLSPDDLAEISVPTFGLDARGQRRVEIGGCLCEMRIVSSEKVEFSWFDHSGKVCVSPPSIVRKEHAADLKRLQREAKDASRMLAAQALGLERSFLTERSWPLEVWRKRFLAHPLTGDLARRLIWQFDDMPAIPQKGGLYSRRIAH